MIPALLFILKITLASQVFCESIHISGLSSFSVKNAIRILIDIALTLWIALSSVDILMIFNFFCPWMWSIFLLVCVSFCPQTWSFFLLVCVHCLLSVSYSFQCMDLSPPWLSLFLNIVFFEVIVNGVDFLENSLSVSSLLVYRNAANFYIF